MKTRNVQQAFTKEYGIKTTELPPYKAYLFGAENY